MTVLLAKGTDACNPKLLSAYDLWEPTSSSTEDGDGLDNSPTSLKIESNFAFIGKRDYFLALDISQPKNMTALGRYYLTYNNLDFIGDIKISNGTAFVANWRNFLTLDVKDAKNSKLLGNYSASPIEGWGIDNFRVQYIAVSGKIGCTGGMANAPTLGKFSVFDISNPERLSKIGVYFNASETYGFYAGIEIKDKIAFALSTELEAIDISSCFQTDNNDILEDSYISISHTVTPTDQKIPAPTIQVSSHASTNNFWNTTPGNVIKIGLPVLGCAVVGGSLIACHHKISKTCKKERHDNDLREQFNK